MLRALLLKLLRFRLEAVALDLELYERWLDLGRRPEPETFLAMHRKKHALARRIQAMEAATPPARA